MVQWQNTRKRKKSILLKVDPRRKGDKGVKNKKKIIIGSEMTKKNELKLGKH